MATRALKFEKKPVDQDVIGGSIDGEGLLRAMHAAGKKAAGFKRGGKVSETALKKKSLAGSTLTEKSKKSGSGVSEGKEAFKPMKSTASSRSVKKTA